jgi:isoleucyl-tRNA synthetase
MTGQAPFTALFGYALLRDEHGEEMHKSKGNAIWFDDAAEQIGADVMRWMFCATNPAVNMNFGYHLAHDEVRRFFLPVWNTYGFFVTYARLDGWTPAQGTDGSAAARTLLDRWILSRLEAVIAEVRGALDAYDAMRATRAVEAFVDELSNWYVRRNRRRFWKGELDDDKRAAYATLHRVLVDLTRLLAPFVPHLAEAMWQNLVTAVQPEAPDSVHLADFPQPRDDVSDEALEAAVAVARQVVALGRTARAASGVRTRQPLATARVKLPGGAGGSLSADAGVAAALAAEVLDELNVKALDVLTDESGMVERTLYPLLPVVGPRHGKAVGAIMAGARSGDWQLLDDGRVTVGGVTMEPDEFQLTARARPGHEVAEEGDLLVALDTELTPELEAEGLAREVAHRLQTMRKAAGYEISDRVEVSIGGDQAAVARLEGFREWLAAEVLAVNLRLGAADGSVPEPDLAESLEAEGQQLDLAIRRA